MQLYATPTTPYGRIARIVVREKGLADRIEIVAPRTRTPGSPYYAVVASGRVPYLRRDDGTGLEDSALICRYLDALDGAPRLHPPPETGDWDYGRLESAARSMLDGLAVYSREVRRPTGEQSPTVVAHEIERARRIAGQWDTMVTHPLMRGPLNMAQIILFVALDTSLDREIHDWRPGRQALTSWYDQLAAHPSIAGTK